jgi:hypothetical protein
MQDAIVGRWHVTAVSMTRYVVLYVYRSQKGSEIARAGRIAQECLGRSPADGDEAQWPKAAMPILGTNRQAELR